MAWVLRALLVLLVGCASAPSASLLPHNQGIMRGRPAVLATLARTGEQPGCPVYRITVYRDGRVEYHGERAVAEMGDATGRLAPSEVADLAAAFDAADYFTMSDAYLGGARESDEPTAVTTFAARGRVKRVVHALGDRAAPARLGRLEVRIETLVHAERWVGGARARGPVALGESW